MRFRIGLAALAALLLGACAHDHRYHRMVQFVVPDATQPAVVLRPDGQLIVNQEPLIVPKPGRVTFRLPPGSGLSFDPNSGVRVLGLIKNDKGEIVPLDRKFNDLFPCQQGRVQDGKDGAIDPQAYVCDIPNTGKVAKGFYAYEINVAGPQGKFRADPTWYPPDP